MVKNQDGPEYKTKKIIIIFHNDSLDNVVPNLYMCFGVGNSFPKRDCNNGKSASDKELH
jgi:hypothetical protein